MEQEVEEASGLIETLAATGGEGEVEVEKRERIIILSDTFLFVSHFKLREIVEAL